MSHIFLLPDAPLLRVPYGLHAWHYWPSDDSAMARQPQPLHLCHDGEDY